MEKKTLPALKKKLISQHKGESGSTSYYPKGGDEQRFVDKHTIEVTDDANGNDDEVFKGTKVKYADRTAERHGYDSPDDKRVHEDVELDERDLSSGEMKKREDYVKGMKKGLKGFKQRYGKDAEAVMYATATKMAKEEYEAEEIDVSLLELFCSLSEDNREIMIEMIDNGLEEQIAEFIKEESEELNG
jgi:hypothetical protein